MNVKEKYEKYVITKFVARIEPVEVEKAEGCIVKDKSGKEYLDCYSGISVTNAGHRHPEVINAAKEQMDKYVHVCTYVYYVEPVADLAEKLAEVTPGRLEKSFFGNSGAEANEGAMRIAKKYTRKNEFIALRASFHGRTIGTLSITGNYARKRGGGPFLSGIAFAPTPYCYRCPFGKTYPNCNLECAKAVEDVFRFDTSDNVAAFIAEPVMGEGGIIPPPKEYFKEVKSILEKHGTLFIADEVQSGFGRTGKLFAIEHYGVEPDIMTLAKGIADGFPISAFITRKEIAEAFEVGDHLSTFGGNPVSAKAALANLEVMLRDRLPEKAEETGKYLMDKLYALKEKHPLIGDVRGKGLMIGIELVLDEKKTPADVVAGKVRSRALDEGLLIGKGGVYGNVIRFQPPLVITKSQIDEAVTILDRVLEEFKEEYKG